MKKFSLLLLVIISLCLISACGDEASSTDTAVSSPASSVSEASSIEESEEEFSSTESVEEPVSLPFIPFN